MKNYSHQPVVLNPTRNKKMMKPIQALLLVSCYFSFAIIGLNWKALSPESWTPESFPYSTAAKIRGVQIDVLNNLLCYAWFSTHGIISFIINITCNEPRGRNEIYHSTNFLPKLLIFIFLFKKKWKDFHHRRIF